MNILKRYPLTTACVALIWILCFMPVKEEYVPNVALADKWAHMLMYLGTCGVLWTEHRLSGARPTPRFTWLTALLAPVLMSGLIELGQAYLTTYRSGDWLDFVANSLGVVMGMVYGRWILPRLPIRKR